jgi:hypothetical protein
MDNLRRAGFIAALIVTAAAALQFDVSKDCLGGAFSAGFSNGFDIRRCDLVVKRTEVNAEIWIPLPAKY